jgi:hypothetical protein
MRLTPRMKKVMDHEYGQNKVEDDFSVGGVLYNGAKSLCMYGCYLALCFMKCCFKKDTKFHKTYKYV